MMGQPINRKHLLVQTAAATGLVVGLIAWLVHAETKPLDRNELEIEVGHLRSYSAEAGLLAEEAASTRVTVTFFQTQSYLLRDKVERSSSSLESALVDSGLEANHRQARQLALQLKTLVESLSGFSANPNQLSLASSNLKILSAQLKAAEQGLKE
jgi:hypothetical protein